MISRKDECSVLVVSSSDKIYEYLIDLLPKENFYPISRATSAGEARRILVHGIYDIVIINTPLPDEFGVELAKDLSNNPQGIMLMVKDEIYPQIVYQMEDEGVVTVSKPTNKQILTTSVTLLKAVVAKLRKSEKKIVKLEQKMADMRIINHAKWLLIDEKNMKEEEAHHYIEHVAMDRRMSKKEAAEWIIEDLE